MSFRLSMVVPLGDIKMSTGYTTDPKISYDEFVSSGLEGYKIYTQDKPLYICPCQVIESTVDGRKNYIHVMNEDGYCRFERFGRNHVTPLFEDIIKKYNVKVYNEYGVEYPD
jgi:hypothetical protein